MKKEVKQKRKKIEIKKNKALFFLHSVNFR